jgi:hypothetical protein
VRQCTVTIISAAGEDREVIAWTSSTPGLVVHASVGDPGWIVTHERSGACVAMVDDPESAQALATALGPIGWDRCGVDILADRDFCRHAKDVIAMSCADNFVHHHSVVRLSGALQR